MTRKDGRIKRARHRPTEEALGEKMEAKKNSSNRVREDCEAEVLVIREHAFKIKAWNIYKQENKKRGKWLINKNRELNAKYQNTEKKDRNAEIRKGKQVAGSGLTVITHILHLISHFTASFELSNLVLISSSS